MALTTDTFERPKDLTARDDPKVLYARSYLLIRLVVGGIGVLLPTLLLLAEWLLLRGSASVRGSLSAYYHSSARDLFVGALVVMGFFLLTYMAGQRYTADYWLSTVAGITVLGVAFLPTQRPNLGPGAALCGSVPEIPRGCTQLQHVLGETAVAAAHYVSAGVFILSLAILCFVFATRETRFEKAAARARLHNACGAVILAALAFIGVGEALDLEVLGLHPLYIGEVVSVYAFGASWLLKSTALLELIFKRRTSPRAA